MSNNCYQIAYEQAISEIAEIDVEIQRLACRKELLEKILGPLRLLLPESSSVAISAAVAEDSDTEVPATEAAAGESVIVLMDVPEPEPDAPEAADPLPQGVREESNGLSRNSGRAISDEDVAGLAYHFWNERGQAHGHHDADWFRAAHELHRSAC